MNHVRVCGVPVWCFLILWLVLFGVLMGATLNSTKPFKGDESFYITSSIDMIRSGNYLEPIYFGEYRFQKPILPYWITVAGYLIFGISLWSGRILFLLLSIVLLAMLYYFTKHVTHDDTYALLSVVMLSSSMLFLGFSRHAMCDLPFTFFITISLFSFYRTLEMNIVQQRWYVIGWIFAALACLSKFLLGLAPVIALGTYLIIARPKEWKQHIGKLFHPLNIFIFTLIMLPWYIFIAIRHPEAFIAQSGNETSAFMIDPLNLLSNTVFYLLVLIRFYMPFTLFAGYIWLKKRVVLPSTFGYFLWYCALVFMLFIVLINRQRERYLLILFPVLTVMMSVIFQKTCKFSVMFRIAVALFFIESTAFIAYPFVSGEQVKELVACWREQDEGGSIAASIERRKVSWVQALTHGNALLDPQKAEYIITGESGIEYYPGYHIVEENERISRLRFLDGRFQVEKQKYYLLSRIGDSRYRVD